MSEKLPIFRVRCEEKRKNYFSGRYKGHELQIEREDNSDNWYILVWCPDGTMAYDGWWRDSADKTIREAIAEALRGSILLKTKEA